MLSQYFSHIAREAALDPKEYSILDLTKEIARRAGYRREDTGRISATGNHVYKNVYTNTKQVVLKDGKTTNVVVWDSILSAKWYMKFKGYLISELIKHRNLEYYYSYILREVFNSTFSALDIDRLKYDGEVVKFVKSTFCSRLGIALWEHGSDYKVNQQILTDAVIDGDMTLEEALAQGLDVNNKSYKTWITTGKKAKHPLCRMTSANDRNESLDYLSETVNYQVEDNSEDYSYNSLVLSIKSQIGEDEVGLRLLEGLLNSNDIKTKFTLKNVGDFITFKKSELAPENIDNTKKSLVRAYKIITDNLIAGLKDNGVDTQLYEDYANKINKQHMTNKFDITKVSSKTAKVDNMPHSIPRALESQEECSMSM